MNFLRSLIGENISIILDRSIQTFYPGEIITGRLILDLVKPIKWTSVELSFYGHAKTLVKQQVQNPNDSYYTKNHYPNNTVTIINNNNKYLYHSATFEETIQESFDIFRQTFQFPFKSDSHLQPGHHELPFQFPLPINLPSSFQYKHMATIEYYIKASLGWMNKKKELYIEVCGFPLVSPSELTTPVFGNNTKKIGLFNRKELNLRCDIPRAGWTVGQSIPINCVIDNYSLKNMTLSASLKQEITVSAKISKQTHKEKLVNTLPQQVLAQCIGGKFHIDLKLPNHLAVVQNTCRTIQVNYYIEIKLDIPLSFNHYCKLPIIVTYQQLDGQYNGVYQQLMPQPTPYPIGPSDLPGMDNNNNFYPPLPNDQSRIYDTTYPDSSPSAPPPPPYSEHDEIAVNNPIYPAPITPYPTLPPKN